MDAGYVLGACLKGLLFAVAFAIVVLAGNVSAVAQPSLPAAAPAQPLAAPVTPRVTNPAPPADADTANAIQAVPADAPVGYITYHTPYEYLLTWITIVLGIGMAVILCGMHLWGRATADFDRTFIILLVVFAALFLIVAGYSEKQTAPVFGLLGTIVGYIFGQMGPQKPDKPDANEK